MAFELIYYEYNLWKPFKILVGGIFKCTILKKEIVIIFFIRRSVFSLYKLIRTFDEGDVRMHVMQF